MISACFVNKWRALLAPALQISRQIKLDGNLIRFALLKLFKSIFLVDWYCTVP